MLRKAIVVDLEGVLLNVSYGATFEKLAEYGVHVAYDKTFQALVREYDAGRITTTEMYEKFCLNYCQDAPLEKAQFTEAWNAMLLEIPDPNLEYLLKLKQTGYTIILLSNINELHAANVRETYGTSFSQIFDKEFYSFETHELKPGNESYKMVMDYLAELDINKENTMFVDDTLENVKSALANDIPAKRYPMNGSQRGIFLRAFLDNHAPLFFWHQVRSEKPAQAEVVQRKLGANN